MTNTNVNANANMNMNMNTEHFTTYQDVKIKTVNWCSKMKDTGLITPDQYDKCVTTFADAKSGLLPSAIKEPSTGMQRTYSLYNTRSKKLSPSLSTDDNSNTVMFVTHTGLYMACNSNNGLYYVKDINDSKINQNDLYFVLVNQSDDVYYILSPYGKYLLTDTNWGASFSGTSIGSMASWLLSKINDKITLESYQYRDYYLSFVDKDSPLQIIYGENDSMQWTMIPKTATNSNDNIGEYTGVEYKLVQNNILTALSNTSLDQISLNLVKKALVKLQDNIRENYNKIEKHMRAKLNYEVNLYNISNKQYENSMESLNSSSTISKDAYQSLADSIPKPSGLTISTNDINAIIYNIANAKNTYIQSLENEINSINLKITKLNLDQPMNDYNLFMVDIQNEIANATQRIQQNNLIMGRQKDNYDTLNNDVSYIDTRKDKVEKLDKTLKLNLDIVDGYKSQSSLLLKLYPFIIIILILFLIYLTYSTIIKFKANIYDKYVE
jgi:hypothetical protein